MLKFFTTTICALIPFIYYSQIFTIDKATSPFNNIIEWKGMGGILMNKNANSNQIYLTLVGDKDKSIWNQQIAPPNEKYYFISSENARYVYFLRNLNPESGKIYFDQLNSAGNVKYTNVSLQSVIRNLGYEVQNLELKNVVVTDKALVHHFRYHDKKEKVFVDIATFITHHNMLVYAVELGKSKEDDVKNGKLNTFQYIGFTGDEICFADYSSVANSKSWNVIVFNSKGQEQKRVVLKNKAAQHQSFGTVGFGTTGSHYLGTQKDIQNGLVSYHNGKFYFTILNNSSGKNTLELYELNEDNWKLINSHIIHSSVSKRQINIGIYPLNEALTYRLSGGDNGEQVVALPLDGSASIVTNFNESIIFNPSRSIISDKKEFFAVTLPSGNLFFDKNQLKKEGSVEFEFIKR